MVYSVSFLVNIKILGPKPMENSRANIPARSAKIKCPNSWTKTSKPNMRIKAIIVFKKSTNLFYKQKDSCIFIPPFMHSKRSIFRGHMLFAFFPSVCSSYAVRKANLMENKAEEITEGQF